MYRIKTPIWTAVGTLALAALVFAPAASADQVILDDLIVDGSICVGLDCVNGESFGFDTLRLKENNLRIKFQDTSTSASFPSRDWQITANDSSNGGLNHFSIDDIDGGRTPFRIEAGAPTASLYVDDGGRIGLGTSTPVVEVHIVDGDTPTLRLEQDGSSGFTPQTWDVAGNETNFFIRDATNGSKLPFRIRPNAPSNSIVLDASGSGKVVFGSATPNAATTVTVQNTATNGAADVHVSSGADEDAIIGLGNDPGFPGANAVVFGYNGSSASNQAFIGTRPGSTRIAFNVENTERMAVDASGLDLASTCIELGTLACTASAGAGFSCAAGSCP